MDKLTMHTPVTVISKYIQAFRFHHSSILLNRNLFSWRMHHPLTTKQLYLTWTLPIPRAHNRRICAAFLPSLQSTAIPSSGVQLKRSPFFAWAAIRNHDTSSFPVSDFFIHMDKIGTVHTLKREHKEPFCSSLTSHLSPTHRSVLCSHIQTDWQHTSKYHRTDEDSWAAF